MTRSLSAIVFASAAFVACAQAQAAGNPWQSLPATDKACPATKLVDQDVTTVLVRTNEDKMQIILSDIHWKAPVGTVELTLQVDDRTPVALRAQTFGPVVRLLIADDALAEQIKHAANLTWSLPWGASKVPVAGLGAAYDALPKCS